MRIESFSAGYWIVPYADVIEYSGNRAVIQDDDYFELLCSTGQDTVIGSTGKKHFEIYPERSVPSGVVAIPRDDAYAAHNGDTLLIAKQNAREVFCGEGLL